jgi:TonB-dependent receptor
MLARLRQLTVVALSALLLPAAASAQQGSVTGTVTDALTGFTLSGATVQIESLGRGAITNESGRFALLGLPAGSHTISVAYLGYGVATQSVNVQAGEVINVDIAMEREAIALEGLQVTGQRAGQAAALNQQLTSLNITNVIAADQIGRFPDSNIGDALKRVPGIVVIQDQGEARFGLIRGTEPRFNSVMINGERIPSAEAEVREVQLDLIPADMVSQVEVNKALTPDMDADAIGGAVNIVTRAAPSQRRVSATLGSGINLLSDQPIGIGSLVFGDRFFDDKLGMVLSGSIFSHNLGSDNIEAEWDQGDAGAYLSNFEVREYQIDRVRRSVSASFDYELSEGNTLIWRSIYNTRDDWENRFRTVAGLEEPDANGVQEVELERETKGGIGNDRVDFRRLEDQRTQSHSLSGEHIFGSGVQFEWSGQFAQASEERLNERYINFVAEGLRTTADISDPRNPFVDPVNNVGARPTASDFEFDELTEETQFTRDRDFNFRADLTIPLREGQTELKVGGRYRGKEKLRENDFFEFAPAAGQFATLADVPLNDYSNPDYLAGRRYQIGNFATQRFLGDLDLQSAQFDRELALGEFAADNFDATETITGGYLMVTQQFGPRTSAIAGVRVETTDNSYTGNIFNDNTGSVEPTTAESSYTDVFPSIQVRHELGDRTVLRGAWTNTIARPNYFQLTPFRVIEDQEIEIGNPDLEPTRSMNFDLMFESYFDNVGIFQAGIFHKEIEDFIVGRVTQDVILDGQQFDQLTEPFNGASARLTGFEIAFQRNLDFLPGLLAGLGVYANYTYTNSSAEDIGIEGREEEDLPLPGTSENTFNGSLSYDYGRISLRASVNFQDDFIDPGELGDEAFFDRYYEAQTQVDLNGSIALTRSAQFFFEVNNLTNEPLAYYQGIPSRLMQREFYDTRIQTGLKIDVN